MLFSTTHFEIEIYWGMLYVRLGKRGICLWRNAGGWMLDHDF